MSISLPTLGSEPFQPPRLKDIAMDRHSVRAGDLSIVNVGPWTPAARKENRPSELWLEYMHGIVDFFATPVPWKELFGPNQNADNYLVNEPLHMKFKTSDSPAVRLVKSRRIDFEKPIPMDMDQVRGREVRFFVWLKGKNAGTPRNCWHGPDMYITFKDAEGNPLAEREGYFQTQGTYPWHCYYQEMFVPREAAGV
ncbi:MAG: hypothetical protein JXA11_16715, partial [Phycisphaerae bacterium]|nr:hypothetical protein [Phycisphaerae bacterium]